MLVPSRMYAPQAPLVGRHTDFGSKPGSTLTLQKLPTGIVIPQLLDSLVHRDVRKTSLSVNQIVQSTPTFEAGVPKRSVATLSADNRSVDQRGKTYQKGTKLEARMYGA